MTKLPFWSKERSSHNPGGTGYPTYVLFSSCEQLCPTSWVSWNGAWQGPHGSYQQPPGACEQDPTLPPASLSPSTSGLCEKPKASQFMVTAAAPFAKISSISAPHSQSPQCWVIPCIQGKELPSSSHLKVQEVPTTGLPQREHHKRELCNHAKTNSPFSS